MKLPTSKLSLSHDVCKAVKFKFGVGKYLSKFSKCLGKLHENDLSKMLVYLDKIKWQYEQI